MHQNSLSSSNLALCTGSSQFFNDARRKMREPGKIHHVRDVRWKGLGMACAPFKNPSTRKAASMPTFLAVLACTSMSIPGDSSLLNPTVIPLRCYQ